MRSGIVLVLLSTVAAFVPHPRGQLASQTSLLAEKTKLEIPENQGLQVFTGGVFDKAEDEAIKIASKIKSVKDLGWTKPPKRPGTTRPRHRAYGGADEEPMQKKANYDESNPRCVEKWLTQEDFNAKFRCEGPAADTVFVALAGGAAYGERETCEKIIEGWRPGGKFDEAAFLRSVQKGRFELAAGWAIFLSVNTFFACGIIFPTNPTMKFFESLIAGAQGGYVN